MKTFRFILTLILMLAFGLTMNMKFSQVPPLGKILSPFHGYLQNIEDPNQYDKEIKIKTEYLDEPVEVLFDELMIPHIYAQNEHDLYYVQGYLDARDRLWQMDFLTRVIMGRISEVVGERALSFDRLNRRLGFKRITEQLWTEVQKDPKIENVIQSYSDGVNAYIAELSYSDYPLEFKLLDYAPEEWSPLKSCFAQAFYSNTLSRPEGDLENTNALALFGKELFNQMYPEQDGNLDPVIPAGTKWDFKAEEPFANFVNEIVKTAYTIYKPSPLIGSNNFAIAPSKTQSGNVILGNEMDLPLTLPSVWHAAHQHIKGKVNTLGVTVPGIPLFMVGFNDSIAWGMSNSPRDQVDWYSIKFRTEDREEYWYNNQWFKTEKIIEKIKIRGAEAYHDTIIYVHHGPVVYDRNFLDGNEKSNYAMKWMAHQPSTSIQAMYNLNRAQNLQQYLDAMEHFSDPPQNVVFGSAAGDIGIVLPGNFPIKPKGKGKFLLDGSKLEHEWTQSIPYAHALKSINPKRGFLSSANQHPVDSLYPYYTYDYHYEKYRNRRINDRLKIMDNIKPKDLMKLQNDNYNYQASESLPAMLDCLDTASFSQKQWQYYADLKNWDYFNEPELTPPSLYELWWNILYDQIWDEFDTATVALNKPDDFTTIFLLKNNPHFPLFNKLGSQKTESAADLYKQSFQTAVDSLDGWVEKNGQDYRWYQFKNTSITHLLKLKPFSYEHVKIGGGKGIVNAASNRFGPSWRMVVELDPAGVQAWGVYPGSQTGNPANMKYGHMIDKWAAGEYYPLVFGEQISTEKVFYKISFTPKK